MNSSAPGTPLSTYSPSRELTPSSSSGGACPVKQFAKPIRTTGESLGSLVGASLTVVGDSVYVFGGFDQYTDEVFNALYKLTAEADSQYKWTQVIYTKGRPPAKRNDHTATVWDRNKLVIFGGNGEEDGRFFNDVSVLDLDTLTWWQPETFGVIPEGRVRHSATIYGNKLYIAGGLTDQGTFADTLVVLDLNTWEWDPPVDFVRRSQHISFLYNKRLYVFGGFEDDMSRSNHLSFIDLDRHGVTHLEIDSPSAPSLAGQRFSQICGDQLVVAVTLSMSASPLDDPPVTGLWTLDMPSMQWQFRDIGSTFDRGNWNCFAMAEHDTSFYLCGIDQEPDDYYAMVLRVDLREYGIVPVPPPQLGTDLVSLLMQQSQSADFSIRSSINPESGQLRVHRLVLLARWPHFAQLLTSGMSESLSDTLTLPEPFSVLEAFVRFMYTDTLDEAAPPVLIADLLVMANLYLLPRLLALCVRRLHNDMDVESVSKIFHCAGMAGQRGLQQTAIHFIFEHFGQVVHTTEFRELPREVLYHLWDETPHHAAVVGFGMGCVGGNGANGGIGNGSSSNVNGNYGNINNNHNGLVNGSVIGATNNHHHHHHHHHHNVRMVGSDAEEEVRPGSPMEG
ncbi:hypothetical protein BX666DRAFT_1980181 [Dichotomocladium elegans]|nr:hypothetical protein BX666DRAFT_1980181 [Dichotomocladium elegans]